MFRIVGAQRAVPCETQNNGFGLVKAGLLSPLLLQQFNSTIRFKDSTISEQGAETGRFRLKYSSIVSFCRQPATNITVLSIHIQQEDLS